MKCVYNDTLCPFNALNYMTRRVADLLAESLEAHGIDRIYSVPGESFLPVLDALINQPNIDLVTCRHEGSAGLAAVADSKLTGRAGVFFVSRGPGAFNGGIALHVAEQEAIPLVMFVGQVDTPSLGRGAVQEIDASRAFGGTLKWYGRIDRADHAEELVAAAFAIAQSGTPGPVCVELPEDVLSEEAAQQRPRRHSIAIPECSDDAATTCALLLKASRRPVMIMGSECRTDEFRSEVQRLSEMWRLPVLATNKGQDQFPNMHPNWVGQQGFFPNKAHSNLLEQSDLIIALGTRLGEVTSQGFACPRQYDRPQKLVHIYPDANQIGKRFAPTLAIAASSHSFVRKMLVQPPDFDRESGWNEVIRATRKATTTWDNDKIPVEDIFGNAVSALASHLTDDAVVTTDSGNFAGWLHRIFRLKPTNRLLGSACGSMGTGVPSGLSAALRYPGRQVIAFCGDGGFLMNGNELATAVGRNLDLKIVISNNRSYGTIRTHQQRAYPERVSGTDLSNPDFAALAVAFGAKGFVIDSAASAPDVARAAMEARGPVVIEVRCNADQSLEKSVAAMLAE